jgi:hypothetical protein
MIYQFRKKPVIVDAVEVKVGCYKSMVQHFNEEPGNSYGYVIGTKSPYGDFIAHSLSATGKDGFEMWIKTLEDTMTASYGDWIIKGVNGQFYPCKPDVLQKTYEIVDKGFEISKKEPEVDDEHDQSN